MILYKYSLRKPNFPLTLNTANSILHFRGNRISKSLPILYSTSELYKDADKARQMLSISYYPMYGAKIDTKVINDFECCNNLAEKIDAEGNPDKFTRVWPAFGKTGGSYEFLITNPKKINGLMFELENGGAPDIWHQDAVGNYNVHMIRLMASCVVDVLNAPEEGQPQIPEIYQIKNIENGISANIPLKDKNITLSAAWKNLNIRPEFKFWTCIWKDNEGIQSRMILDPYSNQVILFRGVYCLNCLDFLKYELKNGPTKGGYLYDVLTETIRNLFKKTLLVSDTFFNFHSKKIFLPKQ